MAGPDGESTIHAEMHIGNSVVMLSDENPEWEMKSPLTLGGSPSSLHLYVEDADAAFSRAVEAGCKVEVPVHDAFWGDRYAKVKDPFGHSWGIATHKEDLPPRRCGSAARSSSSRWPSRAAASRASPGSHRRALTPKKGLDFPPHNRIIACDYSD